MKALINLIFRLILWLAYKTYQIEGVNGLLLIVPAKLIAPTLRRYGAVIGEPVEMHSPLIIHNAKRDPGRHYENLRIGSNCYFGRDVFLDLKDRIVIEDNVTVSMRVTFITHTDAGKSPIADALGRSQGPIIIRRGAYIGAGAIILQGIEIGECAVIGAGAVVTQNIPSHAIVAGVPARALQRI